MNSERRYVPAVLDKQIENIEADAFGHRHYAEMLGGLIESEKYSPPFSIGLLGTWGSGKSSIKSLYESSLKDDASTSRKKSRRDRFFPITFNAWRFGGENIKRALLNMTALGKTGESSAVFLSASTFI